jgi:hypothetical protein
MATRKKKSENVPSREWPIINQGTHLTVKTFEDGHTELVWDWDALVNEVREACASAELANMKPAVRAKSKKSVAKSK